MIRELWLLLRGVLFADNPERLNHAMRHGVMFEEPSPPPYRWSEEDVMRMYRNVEQLLEAEAEQRRQEASAKGQRYYLGRNGVQLCGHDGSGEHDD